MSETVDFTIGEGEAARTITLRRPTTEECDVTGIGAHAQVFVRAQGQIAALEKDPVEGVSSKIAAQTFIANDALEQVRARVVRTLATCAGAEAAAWLAGLDQATRWQATLDLARAFAREFATKAAARLGK